MSSQTLLASSESQGSPSDEMHLTIKNLLDENSRLKELVEELEADNRHFQRKLDEYLRSDIDERNSSAAASSASKMDELTALRKEIQFLKKENARLSGRLSSRGDTGLSAVNHRLSGDNNPVLVHQLSELRAARSLCVEQHERKMETMKLENFRLKEDLERLRRTLQLTESANLEMKRASMEISSRNMYSAEEGGYSSLPEVLPSFSSTSHSASHSGIPSSNVSRTDDSLALEVKRLKRQLEKYKTVNIDLDQKLKEANLELRRHTEGQGNWNVAQQMDTERLEAEVSHLRAQLDRTLGENNHLRSVASRQMY